MFTVFYRNPRLLIVTLALVVVAGLGALQTLPRMEDPRFANRNAVIVTALPGADAERVEALVAEPIEQELADVQEIRKLQSSSRAGVSVIQIELKDSVGFAEQDEVWTRVRDALADVESELPAEASKPDFDNKGTYAATIVVSLVWRGEGEPSYAVLGRLAEQLEDRLRQVAGTEHTEIYGLPREEVRVDIDPDALAALGLSPAELARRVSVSDAKVAAGQLRGSASDLLVEVSGEVETLQRVRDVVVRQGDNGQFVRLGDVAEVSKAIEDPASRVALFNGDPGVAVMARMSPKFRIDQWAESADAIVAEVADGIAPGVAIETIFDQNGYVEARIGNLVQNFTMAVGLVVLVVFVMMGWRSAVLVGLALPLSALMVFTAMNAFGVPVHQMSVTGLIIALGLLIDNAIVIVDEVNRRLRKGASPAEAIGGAIRHLIVPLGGSTLTTTLAFMPIVLMPGGAGEFVGSIALGVIFALISSFLVSMTVIPALTGLLNGRGGLAERRHWWRSGFANARLAGVYETALGFFFRRPVLGVLVAVVVPVIGFLQAGSLQEQFFPGADRDQFQVQMRLPQQASIGQTRLAMEAAREVLMGHEQVSDVYFFAGSNAPIFYYNITGGEDDSPFFAQALVQMTMHQGGERVIRELQARLNAALPEAQVLALQLEQGPPSFAPIEMKIFGPDLDTLRELGEEARGVLSEVPQVITTRSQLSDGRPKLHIELDEQAARLAGLDNAAVAAQLDASLEGAVGGSMLEATEELPVRVRVAGAQRDTVAGVASLDLYSTSGAEAVSLSAIGRVSLRPELANIERENHQRVNRVIGHIEAGAMPIDVQRVFQAALDQADFELPAGYTVSWGGNAGERDRAVSNLMASVAVLGVLMATALVLSFGSFRLAGLIGVVAFLSAGLALAALKIADLPFGFMGIVGTMGLIGVAINDSIVVLAAIREDPAARAGDRAAIRRVVMTATRHVLATTFTTIAGFVPLILDGGGFWPPVAVTIGGGVLGATLLALVLAPSTYAMIHRPRRAVVSDTPQDAVAPAGLVPA